jgi:PAS domain S-box-containing protein
MEPGVPFALLAVAELLAVAAFVALAGAACFPRQRSPWSPVLLLGGALLALSNALTGSSLGTDTSDGLAWIRAAGAVLLAIGLLFGRPAVASAVGSGSAIDADGVLPRLGAVLPLGASPAPLAVGTVAMFLAACAALRGPAIGRSFLAGGLTLTAVASITAAWAGSSQAAAEATLVLRGVGAVLILGWIACLARRSLLAKVVASILAGVLTTALACASVVGTVISDRLADQQRSQVSEVAQTSADDLAAVPASYQLFANALTQQPDPRDAGGLISQLCSGTVTLAAQVNVSGQVLPVPGAACKGGVDALAYDDLINQPLVRQVAQGSDGQVAHGIVVLEGSKPLVVALAVAKLPGQAAARVYGGVINDATLAARKSRILFDATALPLPLPGSGAIGAAASSLSRGDAARLAADPRVIDALSDPPAPRTTRVLVSQGLEPSLGIATLYAGSQPTALLVVSATASTVLGVQQTVLRVLFGALVAIALLVGVGGLVLGRQVAEPVRRLTAAAEAVRKGDRNVTAGVDSQDEVGTLSRTFDAMTAGLAEAADELRSRADEEAGLRARLETVLASITDALVVADSSGTVTSVNAAAVDLFGAGALLVGRPVAGVVPGLGADMRAVLRNASGRAVDTSLRRADGSLVPVRVEAEPLTDGKGVVVVLRDTSHERQVEQMKTEFLSNVSHELRTPLTPIQGYADLLRRKTSQLGPERSAEYAEIVLDSSKRLQRVVELLVDVAALDAGRVVPEPRAVAAGAFASERLTSWRGREPARAADLRRRISTDLPACWVDPVLLARAVDELIDNALKYSEPGTPVTIGASPGADPREVRLWVGDRGEGVPEASQERMFTDFAQVDGSATREREGLGLGLTVVRRLADVIDARLEISSVPGQGSVFTLVLPAARPTPKAPGQRSGRSRKGTPVRH